VREIGWGLATEFEGVVAEPHVEKFDAEEVGFKVAEVFDRVTLDAAGADAEGAFLCRGPDQTEGFFRL
jgi:hypothetical protein